MTDSQQEALVLALSGLIESGRSLDDACKMLTDTVPTAEYAELVKAARRELQRRRKAIRRMRPVALSSDNRDPWYLGPSEYSRYWGHYRTHLEREQGWSLGQISSLNDETTKVLGRCGNPHVDKDFRVRGLVVGHVQAGKTANMIGLCAKAADEGYAFIIVLAGMTSELRRQTQRRFQRDLFQYSHHWTRYTTDTEDFLGAHGVLRMPDRQGVDRHVAIVKKNSYVLEALRGFIENRHLAERRQFRTLIIDDECDHASVNTRQAKAEMSKINEHIRKLITAFPRVTYVGYSATPFANVLIDPTFSIDPPDDLYPKDFIIALDEKQGYFGARQLFGRDLDDAGESDDSLDVVRHVPPDEERAVLAAATGKTPLKVEMDSELDTALRWFLLTGAVRRLREKNPVNTSMLIHVSRLVAAHSAVEQSISEWLSDVLGMLKRKEDSEYEKFRKVFNVEMGRVQVGPGHKESWEQVAALLFEVVSETDAHIENGASVERLNFGEPGSRIIIGGDVLSRGLTLEGLTVSYFLRNSRQYDTLMQMGRWFGYRAGYEDLPRVWVTADMESSFRELARVEMELREEIESLAAQDLTPLECAVRIRRVPGLRVTAESKMHAAEFHVAYWGSHIQTRRFRYQDAAWLENNWRATEKFAGRIQNAGVASIRNERGIRFEQVSVTEVLQFLGEFQVSEPDAKGDLNTSSLTKWIQERWETTGELSHWTVGIVQTSTAGGKGGSVSFDGLGNVKLLVRSRLERIKDDCVDIKALMSRQDLLIDCDDVIEVPKSWPETKLKRAQSLVKDNPSGPPPLLLLYPIDHESSPGKSSKHRVPLGACRNVMGLGLSFPEAAGDTSAGWVSVRLPVAVEETDADFAIADIEHDEAERNG